MSLFILNIIFLKIDTIYTINKSSLLTYYSYYQS